jgi:hypothetical protein
METIVAVRRAAGSAGKLNILAGRVLGCTRVGGPLKPFHEEFPLFVKALVFLSVAGTDTNRADETKSVPAAGHAIDPSASDDGAPLPPTVAVAAAGPADVACGPADLVLPTEPAAADDGFSSSANKPNNIPVDGSPIEVDAKEAQIADGLPSGDRVVDDGGAPTINGGAVAGAASSPVPVYPLSFEDDFDAPVTSVFDAEFERFLGVDEDWSIPRLLDSEVKMETARSIALDRQKLWQSRSPALMQTIFLEHAIGQLPLYASYVSAPGQASRTSTTPVEIASPTNNGVYLRSVSSRYASILLLIVALSIMLTIQTVAQAPRALQRANFQTPAWRLP